MGMNDHTTGETSTCTRCRRPIEHGLLLKGYRGSPGTPVWRTLERGHACAVCPRGGSHTPGRIMRGLPT